MSPSWPETSIFRQDSISPNLALHTSPGTFIANGGKHKICHHYEKKPFFAVARKNETMSRHSEGGTDMKEWRTNVSNSFKNLPSAQKEEEGLTACPQTGKHSAETRKRWTQKLCRNRRERKMSQRAVHKTEARG
jgi:hypothetical protein